MNAVYMQKLNDLKLGIRKLGLEIPSTLNAYSTLISENMNNSALPAKTKELIALGIAINLRCESCMLLHIASAIKLGVTPKEIYDTIGVSILSGGGAAIAMGIKAMEILDVSKEQLSELSPGEMTL